MKKQTLLFIGIAVLLIVILNWDKLMAFAKGTSKSGTATKTPTTTKTPASTKSTTTTSSGSTQANVNELLTKGSTGPSVKAMQLLIQKGWGVNMLNSYGADGDYGDETESALEYIIPGYVGSITLAAFTQIYNAKVGTGSGVIDLTDFSSTDSSSLAFDWLNPATW